MAEALLDDGDPHARGAAGQGLGVGGDRHPDLPGVQTVGTGEDLEQERVVGHRRGHRAGVIEGQLDGHDAGVGHQAVGRLHSVDPAVCGGDADRAPLIAADRHRDLARRHHRRAPRGRPARRVALLAGVVDGPRRAGVAPAREAEVLAVNLAGDGAAGIEDARDDGCVHVGDVALEGGGAVHHRDAGQAHVVLHGDPLAGELAARRPFHLRLVVPGVVRVLLALRAVSGDARVLDRRQVVGHALEQPVGSHAPGHGLEEERHVCVREGHPELLGDRDELARRGQLHAGHHDLL